MLLEEMPVETFWAFSLRMLEDLRIDKNIELKNLSREKESDPLFRCLVNDINFQEKKRKKIEQY